VSDYYTVMMAPAVAALFGVGGAELWRLYRTGGRRGWLLPAAVAVTVAWQMKIVSDYPSWWPLLAPPAIALGGFSGRDEILTLYDCQRVDP
jgi:hypothetical protein